VYCTIPAALARIVIEIMTSTPDHSDDLCQICGHASFLHDDVLWPELTEAWGLSAEETAYVNVQQGTRCARCGANVRSQALARALLMAAGASGTLESIVAPGSTLDRRVLEINEAGALTPWLSRLPQHVLASYPEVDLTNLPYPSGSIDIVVHSDTLEHVPDPFKALQECFRVLAPGGFLAFTVPVIVNRLTRSRRGLPPSYHGHAACREPDFQVHTEFGADAWKSVIDAGFSSCQIVTFRYPAGIALVGRR
jgi:SAM-dependent methyltransferase